MVRDVYLTKPEIMQLKRTQLRLESALRNVIALASGNSKGSRLDTVEGISNLLKAYLCTPYDYAALPSDPTDEEIKAIQPPRPSSLMLPVDIQG